MEPTTVNLRPGLFIVRGVVAVAFAFFLIFWPLPALLTLALLFGAYAVVDGLFAFGTALGHKALSNVPPWHYYLRGVAGIIIGVISIAAPLATIMAFSILVGVWALTTGILEIVGALSFPRISGVGYARGLLIFAGILSLFLGVIVFALPAAGVAALLWTLAVFALFFGIMLIGTGIELARRVGETEFPQPHPREPVT